MARVELSESEADPEIAAAGGVVIRRGEGGEPEIAVIHRPKYMDWSLPKGKLEPGEEWLDAALREVEEETGYRCRTGEELSSIGYLDRKGRSKLVRYWLMEPLEGGFRPHDEVDEIRWLSPEEAERELTYDHDRELVREALARA